MALGITQNGIVQRHDEGGVTIHLPAKNGGPGVEIEVEERLAESYRLATGDVVEGVTEPIAVTQSATAASDECLEDEVSWDEQRDEPGAVRGVHILSWLMTRSVLTERLVSLNRINGLSPEEAEERPSARRRRSASERATPDRLIPMATGPDDTTGRLLDFAAPLGVGYAGAIYGPHAGGLTRTLRAVVGGATASHPDMVVLVLLLRARSEEITDWRRRFPQADTVVCPSGQSGTTAEQTLRVADLVLECAQRQTELGRDVLLAVDSLTGLWGAMLEGEEADAQADADRSQSRQRLREWIQKAGDFRGEGPLGGSLGGSLTLIGTVWNDAVDEDAEEDRDIHPHLRLLEHLLHETSWRVPLSGSLARRRLYPAIDAGRCFSLREESLLSPDTYERLYLARRTLYDLSPLARYELLMEALDATPDNEALLARLTEHIR
jgi:transcription termination factor Rho